MTTPFWLDTVDAAGVDPGTDPSWWTTGARFWLGKPEQMMVELPSPNTYTPSPSQGEVEAGRYDGGSSVTRDPSVMRRYTLGWNRLIGRDHALLDAFWRRLVVGNGPWVFVPPEDVNRLTMVQSMCGAANGTPEGWLINAGTLSYIPAVAAPILPCGVMRWAPAAAGNALIAGQTGGTFAVPDADHAMPYLPDVPITWCVWAWASSSGPTLQARLVGCARDGTSPAEISGSAVALTTAPQPVIVEAEATVLGSSQYVLPKLVCGGTIGSRTISMANPIAAYSDDLDVTDWSIGKGIPRVVWPASAGDQPVEPTGTRPWQMVLAETIAGAA